MNGKLVSIIMPVFNAECYLREAIDSILNQTYQNIELLVIEDKSTDNTVNILNAYTNIDRRIKVIQNPCRKGIAKALNLGIDMAEGEYIARMDADDVSLVDRIEKQVAFMEQNVDVGICSTQIQLLWEDGTIMDMPKYPLDSERIKARFLIDNSIAHPTVMFRKSIVKNKWKYNLMPSEDYDLWTRMAVSEEFACLPDILLYYRVHQKNTSRVIQHQTLLDVNNQVIKRYIINLFQMDVSQYKQNDFCVSIDNMVVDEPVHGYLFRQYQLLKEMCAKNQQRNIFDEEVMRELVNERWRLTLSMFECDRRIVRGECIYNFEELQKETDRAVKGKLEDVFEKIRALLVKPRKFIIYGLGDNGTKLLANWKKAKVCDKTGWELVALIDKNKKSVEIGENIFPINKPNILVGLEFDFVLISSKIFFDEIKNELLAIGINEGKVFYGGRMFNIIP